MAAFKYGTTKRQERIVLGIPELDKRLEGLKLSVANKCARAGLSKGARLGASLVKKQIPGSKKSLRKAIGSSVKKAKSGANRGWTQAKFGAAVGKKAAKQKEEAELTKAQRKAAKRPGVGISSRNIHWYIQGTAERTVKKTGQRVGKMPSDPIVAKAMASGKGAVLQAVKEGTLASIDKERMKLVRQYMVTHAN